MKTITIMPGVSLLDSGLLVPCLALNNGISEYNNIEYSSGYGMISSAGVVLQQGVTGTIAVSLKIRSFSSESYLATTDAIRNSVGSITESKMRESIANRNYATWWSLLLGQGKSYQKQSDIDSTHVDFTDTSISKELKKYMQENSQEFTVEGKFEVTGVSSIPTMVQLYIKTMTITEAISQTKTTVIDNQVAAADTKGNVQESRGTLTISDSLV